MIKLSNKIKHRDNLARNGYLCINSSDFEINASSFSSIFQFVFSFNNLRVDDYVKSKEGNPYRYRRYGAFCLNGEQCTLKPFRKYLTFRQEKAINSMYGGINRKFSPATPKSLDSVFLKSLILEDFQCLPLHEAQKKANWFIGYHKVRIICKENYIGFPTPEGIHQDGHCFVAQHLIAKKSIRGGKSQIYDDSYKCIQERTLNSFLDSCIVNDKKVLHSVSPIEPSNDTEGYRDMLIIDFRIEESNERDSI
jgi:hypothetical protein